MQERICILSIPRFKPRWKRTHKGVSWLREFLARNLKLDPSNLKLDPELNRFLWSRGGKNPPTKLRIKLLRFEDGKAEARLAQD